jgi:3-oxoacyl-[acyl-carrier protein] reductase
MTVIAIGPAETLVTALADEVDNIAAIDATQSADDSMWQTLVALRTARERGDRIVLVLPTIGMAGASGAVDYTTAIEGIRAMAKSAARQWAAAGITVNMIAAPVHLFDVPAVDASHLTAPARPENGTLIRSVVETAKFLLREDIDHLVGETIVVDGGSVMLP